MNITPLAKPHVSEVLPSPIWIRLALSLPDGLTQVLKVRLAPLGNFRVADFSTANLALPSKMPDSPTGPFGAVFTPLDTPWFEFDVASLKS